MPWTRKEVAFLESKASPLSEAQKDKMNAELHENPALGHQRKGSPAMKKASPAGNIREMRIEIHRGPKKEITGHTLHMHHEPKATKSAAFMENSHTSIPFDADGLSSTHGHILDHVAEHLGMGEYNGDRSGDKGKEAVENSSYDGE